MASTQGEGKFPPAPESMSRMELENLHRALVHHRGKYGDMSYFSAGGRHLVVLNSVDTMREAFDNHQLRDRPESFSQRYILLNDVTVQSFSDDLTRLRQAMIAGICSTADPSPEMIAAQNQEFSCLKSRLQALAASVFDPRDIIAESVISGTIIGLIGRRLDYDHDIFDCYRQFDVNGRPIYGSLKANFILTMFPWLRFMCCGYGMNFKRSRDAMGDISRYLLHDVKSEGDISKPGMMYEMLRAQRRDDKLTDAQISAAIIDMHASGNLALTAALSSVIYQLICHRDVQDKMHVEIDAVIGKENQPTLADLDKMPYCSAVILEVFRQCPVFSSTSICSNTEEVVFRGYSFPPGTVFVPNMFGVNHDADVWTNPWNFDPHRFLDDKGLLLPEDHSARQNLILFGSGPRECLGKHVAPTRVLFFIVNILQSFRVSNGRPMSTADGDPMKYTHNVFIYPPPYVVTITER